MRPRGLLFAGAAGKLDYGRRLSRLRWRRAFPETPAREAGGSSSAAQALELADVAAWIAVRDENSLPLPRARVTPQASTVVLPAFRGAFEPSFPHTLAELEEASFRGDAGASLEAGASTPALVFRPEDFTPASGETLDAFLARLAASPTERAVDPDFAVFAPTDEAEDERQEVMRRVPSSARRVLEVPGRDAAALLKRLAGAKERFDAFVFPGVLAQLEDPVGLLSLARALALPRAALVASVANVGHVSLVRDLVRGRFDPFPAGLVDASRLRWFTRRSLAEALEEAGWAVDAIEGSAGAPARERDAFVALLSDWPACDRESLSTFRWIALAHADAGDLAARG